MNYKTYGIVITLFLLVTSKCSDAGFGRKKGFLTKILRYYIRNNQGDPLALGKEDITLRPFDSLHLISGSLTGLKGIAIKNLNVAWAGLLNVNVEFETPPMKALYSGYITVASVNVTVVFNLTATTDEKSTVSLQLNEKHRGKLELGTAELDACDEVSIHFQVPEHQKGTYAASVLYEIAALKRRISDECKKLTVKHIKTALEYLNKMVSRQKPHPYEAKTNKQMNK
ncbi:uncharacterized protein LOC119168080 [Rhipicephalus microplus]|uniref:Putative conserved secreted protein n=1 Tax=Rhipicephalus microplus TaxID=6941 RepID=A0A6G5A3B1_RHIMP